MQRWGELFSFFARFAIAEQLFENGTQEFWSFPNENFHLGIPPSENRMFFLLPVYEEGGIFVQNSGRCALQTRNGGAQDGFVVFMRQAGFGFFERHPFHFGNLADARNDGGLIGAR